MAGGWVFCGGMLRSGSTLQYQVASELLERTGMGRRADYVDAARHSEVLVGLPQGGSCTFKTHELTIDVERHCLAGTGVALYIYRDIRDALSSYQTKEGGRITSGQIAALTTLLLDRDRKWRSMPRVYVARYEEVVADLQTEVGRVASFLGLPSAQGQYADVARALDYGSQEAAIRSAGSDEFVTVNATNVYHRQSLS